MTLDVGAPAAAETLTLTDCLGDGAVDALAENSELRADVATARIPAAALAASTEGLRRAFEDALRIPVGEIFKAASVRLSILAPDYVAPESDGALATLALAPMVIESSHHPTITVNCDGVSISLRFDVELSLDVSGAELMIERGHAVGARTGTTSGTARVSYLAATPLELGSPEFDLPGELRFARPIATSRAKT
jgi:hypothetical protein